MLIRFPPLVNHSPPPRAAPFADLTHVVPRPVLSFLRRDIFAVAAVPGRSACVRALAADVAKVSFEGASAGTASLDLKTASPDVAKGLVHKYVVMVRQNARRGTASTLTKSEVRGGGRKPFKQKGTGNARAGSNRTPLKPGGGVVFGPKPKDWSIKMNKKERRLAMATAIQSAAAASSLIVVDSLAGAVPKTKAMANALKSWGVAEGEKAYITTKDAPSLQLEGSNSSTLFLMQDLVDAYEAFQSPPTSPPSPEPQPPADDHSNSDGGGDGGVRKRARDDAASDGSDAPVAKARHVEFGSECFGPEQLEERVANLTRRFPDHSEATIRAALHASGGHGGKAATRLECWAGDAWASE